MFQFRGNADVIIPSRTAGSLARMLLALLRIAHLVVHLAIGFALVVARPRLRPHAYEALLAWWARGVLAALGVKLRVAGLPSRLPGLVVANHISWLDVIAIAALRPAQFVCKAEIAGWPGIGWLLRRAGSIFIRRGSFRDVWRVNLRLRACFTASQSVVAFPEGTTTEGRDVLVFRPALFQPAVERGLPVHPVAIAYSSDAALFVGDTTFLGSLFAIARAHRLEMHVALLRPLETQGRHRRAVAERARSLIAARTVGLRLDAQSRSRPSLLTGVAAASR
jgi:1-acyl-sn-glycerol-3-phosphate acyltransferase